MMNPQEQNQYIQKLLRGEAKPGSELEAATLGQLKGLSNSVAQKKLRHDALSEEAMLLEDEIKRLNGQRDAYVSILIIAETQRRLKTQAERKRKEEETEEKNPQPPLGLNELASRLEADKIEAIEGGQVKERVVKSIEDEEQ